MKNKKIEKRPAHKSVDNRKVLDFFLCIHIEERIPYNFFFPSSRLMIERVRTVHSLLFLLHAIYHKKKYNGPAFFAVGKAFNTGMIWSEFKSFFLTSRDLLRRFVKKCGLNFRYENFKSLWKHFSLHLRIEVMTDFLDILNY